MFLLTLASGCWVSNLIVFLIKEFNIKSIDAAQVLNVVSGCSNFFPLIGAIIADSFLGCFSVIWISSLISLMGSILLVLTVTVDNLRPNISSIQPALQYAILYSSLALICIGVGGTRFTLATMGANQFTKIAHQSAYFNWFFFSLYSAAFIAATGIVYVEDNWSWALGFGIGIGANALGLGLFLMGSPFYIRDKPKTSPFTNLLRVVVASVRKRNAVIYSETVQNYYYGDDNNGVKEITAEPPTNRFRWLNRAAVKREGDILPNGNISTPWKICTVYQVEDLKSLIRVLPLWSSSILLSTPIGIQLSLTILQALATNRHLFHTFQFPASSIIVFSFLSTLIGVTLINRCFLHLWNKLLDNHPTHLQQIGVGHVLNITSMAVSALVESKRRGHRISVAWLVPQMVVVGIGEAFHFPGQVGLYYQEFPSSLKSLATAMVAMLIGIAFYLSSGVIDFMRKVTDWLPNDIDDGRVDYVYWVMVVIGITNFGYFLIISWFYKYKNVEVVRGDQSVSTE